MPTRTSVRLDRRHLLAAVGGAAAAPLFATPAFGQSATPAATPLPAGPPSSGGRWIGTWARGPRHSGEIDFDGNPLPPYTNRTFRQVVRVSAGGRAVRLRLVHAHAQEQVTIRAARIAKSAGTAAIDPATDRLVTFGGMPALRLAPDMVAVSDPVAFDLPPLATVAVSLFVEGTFTDNDNETQTVFVGPEGDATAEANLPATAQLRAGVLLSGIEVVTDAPAGAIVAFGASMTDGIGITPGTFNRWTDVLAERLQQSPDRSGMGVLNAGISGNQLLADGMEPYRYRLGISGLARFDRDVLAQPGATHLVLQLGNNDLANAIVARANGQTEGMVTPEDVIAGQKIVIARARAHGLAVIGTTIPPVGGSWFDAADVEPMRTVLNDWTRESGAFDHIADFDAVLRDPADPVQMLPAYDSGDALHPNDDGYSALAESFDLAWFQSA